jgi:hypothetical protein
MFLSFDQPERLIGRLDHLLFHQHMPRNHLGKQLHLVHIQLKSGLFMGLDDQFLNPAMILGVILNDLEYGLKDRVLRVPDHFFRGENRLILDLLPSFQDVNKFFFDFFHGHFSPPSQSSFPQICTGLSPRLQR